MRHIILIDALERLNIKKDSSLMMALSFQEVGQQVYLLFEQDLYIVNNQKLYFNVYPFEGSFESNSFYLKSFKLKSQITVEIDSADIFHHRIDPPVDGRYLRFCWMLDSIARRGTRVINSPRGILQFNEKLLAYGLDKSLPSYVGASFEAFMKFTQGLKNRGDQALVTKPLDLFSGIGVEKHPLDLDQAQWRVWFEKRLEQLGGVIVAQPFASSVYEGEHRALFYKGQLLGVILKTPQKGEFLTNIAQGASFQADNLDDQILLECQNLNKQLMLQGVDWVAYDILGEAITEVNITCPGLLVEVSQAIEKNLALEILSLI